MTFEPRSWSGGFVNPEHFHPFGHFPKMPQGTARQLIVSTKQICVEDVFPRAPAHGAGFNLAQADLAQGKHAQSLEQHARRIFHAESDRSLIGARSDVASLAEQEKAGKVPFVVLNTSRQDPAFIYRSRLAPGDPGRVPQLALDDMLHPARG